MKIRAPLVAKETFSTKDLALKEELASTERVLAKFKSGFAELQEVIQRDFTPEKMNGYLKELARASDVKMNRQGETYEVPNWAARRDGWDRAYKIAYTDGKDGIPSAAPSKIVFNIVNHTFPDPKTVRSKTIRSEAIRPEAIPVKEIKTDG